ncbi:hypothetical protein NFHSH190041_02550 [Shewanella sp. NFH-SH190041]|nr:hypothetical protein NFHSH190041_02550 [Shewanella sp. NFH-SH190041]
MLTVNQWHSRNNTKAQCIIKHRNKAQLNRAATRRHRPSGTMQEKGKVKLEAQGG